MLNYSSQWKLRIVKLCVLFALCISLSQSESFGQDYNRYRPHRLPRPTQQLDLPEAKEIVVKGSDKILVEELKAVILVDSHKKIDSENAHASSKGIEYDFADSDSLVYSDEFKQIVQGYIGGPITLRRLNELSRELILFYRENGEPVVDVVIPEQKITSGVVQLVVIESRVGQVRVEGGCFFDPCMIAGQICHTQSGYRISEWDIREDLFYLNRNPFRRMDVRFEPGSSIGTTDVIFDMEDWRPWQSYVGYEDTGVPVLNRERMVAGVVWGNAFGRDGILSYQYTTDSDLNHLHAHAVSYQRDLNRCWTFQAYGSWAGTIPSLGASFNQRGESWQSGAHLKRYFERSMYRESSLSVGLDFKSTNTDLEFGGTNVFASSADLVNIAVGYNYLQRYDDDSYLVLTNQLQIGPGRGFTSNHNAASFGTIRAGTQPGYVYNRLKIEKMNNLPNCWQLTGRVTGQVSDSRLLFSEMLGLGGYDTVRGFDQWAVSADHGWFASLELGPQPWEFCSRSECGTSSTLRAYGFVDIGEVYNKSPMAGEFGSRSLSSAGVGMRFSKGNRLSMRIDYGLPLENVPTVDDSGRLHLGVVYRMGGPTDR